MKCLCNVRCRLLKDIDMFGKDPEIYYKGRPKKTSWIGRIFSVIFVSIYFLFFIYKLIKMLKKVNVTFYDTFTYAAEPPDIKITKDNFYGGFALEDPVFYNTFIDESIYYPKAFFKRAEKQGDDFDWQVEELELEPCKLENFGSAYHESFEKKDLKNLYCFKKMDFILEGHFSYDLYSFFYIQFYPCVNTTNKTDCKPLDKIQYYLNNTFVSFQFQDVELTPDNYENPFRPRSVDIYTTVGNKLFKEIHAFFQIVDIQTDMDWIGFDEFTNFKSEKYLKYDEMVAMSNIIEDDIYENGNSFCDFTIKLSENVRIEKRIYTKIITILGDVGGLMEVLFTLFRVVAAFSVDILYEVSLVNNLFSFDLNKKRVILKEKTNSENNIHPKEEEQKSSLSLSPKLKTMSPNIVNLRTQKTKHSKEEIKDESNRKLFNILNKNKLTMKKSNNMTKKKAIKNNSINKHYSNKALFCNLKDVLTINKDQNETENKTFVNKIKMNRACIYFCFCCVRRRKQLQNLLLDEGTNIISEKLDIFNIKMIFYRKEK